MAMENEVSSVIRIRERSFIKLCSLPGELKFAAYLLRNCALTVESLIGQPFTPVTSTLTLDSRTNSFSVQEGYAHLSMSKC